MLDGLDQAADPVAHYQSIQAQVEAELRILEPRLGHFRAVEAQLKQDEADDDVRKSIMAKWEGRDGIPTDQDIMQMTENELIYFLPVEMTRYFYSLRERRGSALSVRKTILGHDADYKYDGKTRTLFVRIFFNDKQSKTFTMNY